MTPELLLKEITDVYVRKNFEQLKSYFQLQNQLLDFKFFDLLFTQAETNKKVAHGLPSIPQDIIVTKIVGTGTVQFNHGLFDSSNLDLTVSAACHVRFFVGSYFNNQTPVAVEATDYTKYSKG